MRAHGSWSAREEDDLHFMIARPLMHHSDKPNAKRFTALFPESPKANGVIFLTIVEPAQLLARQGSLRETHWALNFGRGNIPEFFQMRKVTDHAIGGEFVKRKARKSEINAGLADEQGNLKQIDRILMPSPRPVLGWRP